MTAGRWLTVSAIAADLGVSTETVYGWLRSGALPSKRFGRQYRVRAEIYSRWCSDRPDGQAPRDGDNDVTRPMPRQTTRRSTSGRVARLIDLASLKRAGASGGTAT